MTGPTPLAKPTKPSLARKLPFLAILVIAVVGAFTLREHLSLAALSEHRDALIGFRDRHYLATVIGFMLAYVAVVALSLPGGTVATLAGGFLFGVFPGTLINVLAATVGAAGVFIAARAGFGRSFAEWAEVQGGAVGKLKAGLRDNEWSVLFLMRLVPAVPFFVANLIPAFVGTSLARFVITTFLGIVPGTLVFTSVGAGLGNLFARGETPDLGVLFSPPVLLPILGLAALAALPIILRLWKKGA